MLSSKISKNVDFGNKIKQTNKYTSFCREKDHLGSYFRSFLLYLHAILCLILLITTMLLLGAASNRVNHYCGKVLYHGLGFD